MKLSQEQTFLAYNKDWAIYFPPGAPGADPAKIFQTLELPRVFGRNILVAEDEISFELCTDFNDGNVSWQWDDGVIILRRDFMRVHFSPSLRDVETVTYIINLIQMFGAWEIDYI